MTGQLTTKLRLVRCPRCHRVLPELPNVPVYKCGGCGTVLQAKKRNHDTKNTELHTHETDAVQKNELEHVSEDKETQGLSRKETFSNTGELPLENNSKSDQNETTDGNREQSGDINFSRELSTEITCHGNGESSPAARGETEVNQDECSLKQNDIVDQNENRYCNGKQNGGVKFSNEIPSSTELNHESEELSDSSPVAGPHSEVDENSTCLEQDNGSNQIEYGYCNGKKPGDVNFSDEVASSIELNHLEIEESPPIAGAQSEVHENRNCLEQDNGRNQNEYGYCNGKQDGQVNLSDEVASSTELNHLESEELSPVAGASEVHENRNCLELANGRNRNEYGYCNGKQPGRVNLSDEVASSTELNHLESEELSPVAGTQSEVHENRNCFENSNGIYQSEFGDCKRKWPGNIKFSNEVSSSSELTYEEIEALSPVVETSRKFDENFESAESLLAARPSHSIITTQWQSGESIVQDNLMSPRGEQLEQSHQRALDGFDRVSSTDTLENIALANSTSEFSVTLRDIHRFPTTRGNYAYDGSVSSYDGTDNHVPDQHRHLSRRKFKKAESASAKAMPRREEVMNKISSYPEMQHQPWDSSLVPSEKKHYAMKGSKWHQDELPEPTGHDHPVKSRMKFESGECLSRVPFYSRGSQVGYEKGSTSNYGKNKFQCGTSIHSSKKPGNPEEEKIELLKMVYELQDQINRTRISKGKGNIRFPGVAGTEKQIPSYYDHVAPEVEICHDLSYTRCPRRCNQGKSQPHHSRISRIPFSAETGIGRHQVDHSCLHCYPQDWQRSTLLPPHVYCNKSQYIAHPHQRYYNLHCSDPSSPQHYPGCEFSFESCDDTKPDDRWHKNHEVKYPRERHQLKRHVRPVSGGAPFIICYHCSNLLQLPADFLLFRRRCHKLKCSACSVVLKFSLQNGTRIVPYTDYTRDAVARPPSEADDYISANNGEPFSVVLPPHALKRDYTHNAVAPPPSEADDYSSAHNGRNLASVSYALKCPHADPVSYSDDYGPSLCKSCSTEGEPFSVVLPPHALKRDFKDRNMSSGSSFEPMGERKMRPIFKESPNRHKNPVDTFASGWPSSKVSKAEKSPSSSEIEPLRPISGSPLHRLMGYSTPSQVIRN